MQIFGLYQIRVELLMNYMEYQKVRTKPQNQEKLKKPKNSDKFQ